jgi:hypothetical protein
MGDTGTRMHKKPRLESRNPDHHHAAGVLQRRSLQQSIDNRRKLSRDDSTSNEASGSADGLLAVQNKSPPPLLPPKHLSLPTATGSSVHPIPHAKSSAVLQGDHNLPQFRSSSALDGTIPYGRNVRPTMTIRGHTVQDTVSVKSGQELLDITHHDSEIVVLPHLGARLFARLKNVFHLS